ncbi:MAG: O-phosphoseryl-tRNA(Sec) selenium transferase, partial [Promethearchaeota archaeon]
SMLSLGVKGYQKLIEEQQKNRKILEERLTEIADKIGERVLQIFNPVAVAISLNTLEKEQIFSLGGALYNLRVTGPRVYDPSRNKFGTCCDNYPIPYLIMNAAIGATPNDIISAIERFEKAYNQVKN